MFFFMEILHIIHNVKVVEKKQTNNVKSLFSPQLFGKSTIPFPIYFGLSFNIFVYKASQ